MLYMIYLYTKGVFHVKHSFAREVFSVSWLDEVS